MVKTKNILEKHEEIYLHIKKRYLHLLWSIPVFWGSALSVVSMVFSVEPRWYHLPSIVLEGALIIMMIITPFVVFTDD